MGEWINLNLSGDAEQPKKPGSGLGLYIARGIAHAHDGEIWAESAGPNQGATFTFTIRTN